jgi:hypothetical protein
MLIPSQPVFGFEYNDSPGYTKEKSENNNTITVSERD